MRVFLAPLAIWIQAVDSASALRACPAFRPFPFASLTLSITCPQSALIVLNVAERPDLYARTAGPALVLFLTFNDPAASRQWSRFKAVRKGFALKLLMLLRPILLLVLLNALKKITVHVSGLLIVR